MPGARLLFVDDDPAIRQVLPSILSTRGYEVTVAGSVPQALAEIASHPFDVLIADLNIGEPGDGFTVVSAMHRTHPNCRNLIMTGFPALETALQAIREQVDSVLVKPTNIAQLLSVIDEKLVSPPPLQRPAAKRVSELLRDNSSEITQRSLRVMKAHPGLAALPLSDEQRISTIPAVLENLAAWIDSCREGETQNRLLRSAAELGRIRRAQGFTVPLLMENVRIVQGIVGSIIGENLLSMDLSRLWTDVQSLTDGAVLHMKGMLDSYLNAEQRAA
jgi:ActR/RegA family two-component response regulator